MKWNEKRGWRWSQRWISAVGWLAKLSKTTCTASSSGTCPSIRSRKRRNSRARGLRPGHR